MIQSRWKRRQAGEKPVRASTRGAPPRSLRADHQRRDTQARPDMVDRIMDGVEPSEWGPAAEQQLCYEIKVRPALPLDPRAVLR
jgi:hypothetical protein